MSRANRENNLHFRKASLGASLGDE